MTHLESQAKALKLAWVKRLFSEDLSSGWRQIVNYHFLDLSTLLFQTNLNFRHVDQIKLKLSPFWTDVLRCWCIVNYDDDPDLDSSLAEQSIWYNSNIRLNGKILFNKKFFVADVRKLGDIIKTESKDLLSIL